MEEPRSLSRKDLEIQVCISVSKIKKKRNFVMYSGLFSQIQQRQGLSLDLLTVCSSILPMDCGPFSPVCPTLGSGSNSLESHRQVELIPEAGLMCCSSTLAMCVVAQKQSTHCCRFSQVYVLSPGDSTNCFAALPSSLVALT